MKGQLLYFQTLKHVNVQFFFNLIFEKAKADFLNSANLLLMKLEAGQGQPGEVSNLCREVSATWM